MKEEEYARLVEKNRKLDRKREVQQANMEAEVKDKLIFYSIW